MANRQDHLKKLQLKKQAKEKAGLVSDRFPEVAGIVVQMTYYQNSEHRVLMERTVNIFPSSHAYFNMECMIRECDDGGFDLTPIISRNIRNNRKMVKGNMECRGKKGEVSPDHACISYQIKIKYNKTH